MSAARVAELVKECLLFSRCEVAEDGHQLFEGILVLLKTLVLSMGEEVEDADETLEFSGVLSVLR
jgi:hypothetical protein